MAIYRNIQMSFWTDTKITDEFSPEEKYVYIYLMTNPHTNLCGCYELSKRQACLETGLTTKKFEEIMDSLEKKLNVIRYSNDSKEVLLINWHKYNWTSSEKFRKPLEKELNKIKEESFKQFLFKVFNGEKAEIYGMDTYCIDTKCSDTTVAVTVTDTVTDTVLNKQSKKEEFDKEFEELWKLYPRKLGKVNAKKAYIKARQEGTTFGEARAGIESYAAYVKREKIEDRFIKHGSTYFNQRSWTDEYPTGEKPMSDIERKQREGYGAWSF